MFFNIRIHYAFQESYYLNHSALLNGIRLPFNKTPIKVDLTRYLYVIKPIIADTIIATKNFISIQTGILNIENVKNDTTGK